MNNINIDKVVTAMALLFTNTIESIIEEADKEGVDRDTALGWFASVMGQFADGYSIAKYDLNGPRHPLADKNKEENDHE